MLTIPYYITIATLGNIDHGAAILGYIGLIEMAACYVSIGIFSSELCRTPVTAFFLSLGIGLCFQVFFRHACQPDRNRIYGRIILVPIHGRAF